MRSRALFRKKYFHYFPAENLNLYFAQSLTYIFAIHLIVCSCRSDIKLHMLKKLGQMCQKSVCRKKKPIFIRKSILR